MSISNYNSDLKNTTITKLIKKQSFSSNVKIGQEEIKTKNMREIKDQETKINPILKKSKNGRKRIREVSKKQEEDFD